MTFTAGVFTSQERPLAFGLGGAFAFYGRGPGRELRVVLGMIACRHFFSQRRGGIFASGANGN